MILDFVSLFFPHYCLACGKGMGKNETYVCTTCDFELPKTESHLTQDHFVAQKFYGRVQLKFAIARYLFVAQGRVQHLLHHLKYKNFPELGVYLGKQYANDLDRYLPLQDLDGVLSVPLHQAKLKIRGYNQSEEFARGLAEGLAIPLLENGLKRIKNSKTQTSMDRLERLKNVESVFEVTDNQLIKDKKLLLVDDVITTGATLEACITTLQKAGAAEIGVAAIAAVR